LNWELETDTGIYFWGGILSNWAKFGFVADLPGGQRLEFNCAEQYMMAVKAEFFKDYVIAERIMNSSDPKKQKALGRMVSGYSDERWNPVARDLTYPGIFAKFDQNEGIKKALLGTGNKIIVEASPLDKKWGVGLAHNDMRIFDQTQWLGTNWLGELLMRARNDLRK
jgi:ribA/ribD-fused uncharacterized protein